MARGAARFGIVFLPERFDGWGELCRETEDAGFEWVGVADSQSVFRELYVALTLAALHTRRVRLGPLVTNPLTRHLVVTASAMASVDEVANMIVYVCSPQASATTGAALRVDGGVVDTIA